MEGSVVGAQLAPGGEDPGWSVECDAEGSDDALGVVFLGVGVLDVDPLAAADGVPEGDSTIDTRTTRDGIELAMGYDEANRLLSVTPTFAEGVQPPTTLAPLDGGDTFSYDELSRPLALTRGGVASLSVATPSYDLASRPLSETVGSRGAMSWTWDTWSRPTSMGLPGLATSGAFTGYDRSYDTLDRIVDITPIGPLSAQTAGATWSWGGQRLYAIDTKTALHTGVRYGYIEGRGPERPDAPEDSASKWQLGTLTWGGAEDASASPLTAPEQVWGQFAFGYRGQDGDPRDGAKVGRAAVDMMSGGGLDLFAGLGWVWDYDAGVRLSHAVAGRGDISGRAPPEAENTFGYEYGEGDELERIVRSAEGEIADLEIGPQGRITARSGVDFDYDQVGRRSEDDRFTYLWNWRSELVQVTVRDTWPEGEETPFAGHQVRYQYDAVGRLHSRSHYGPVPDGGTETDRPFVERRAYVWEVSGLVAEVAYGDEAESQIRWRKSYVPGASGYDDAVQVAVEILDFPGSTYGGKRLYTYLRDEQGTVIGLVAEDEGTDPESPPIPVRYLYTPYGEAHAEVGPEIRRARYDAGQTSAWGQSEVSQTVADGLVGGAIRVQMSGAMDASTLVAGIDIEHLTSGGWTTIPTADLILGTGQNDPTEILVLLRDGWQPGDAYRATLDSDLRDMADRPIFEPEPLEWQIPEPNRVGSPYDERFPIRYESFRAAGNTVSGRFPGGQSGLFQGLWTDPITGQSYARARWYDARNASFLIEDPMADLDSPNLYAFVGWKPNMATDPTGMCSVWETIWNEHNCRDYFTEAWDENWEEDKEKISMAVSFIPIIGDLKDAQEAITGVDAITGRELSFLERGISAIAAVVPVVSGSALRAGGKAAKEAVQEGSEAVAKTVVRREAADISADAASKLSKQGDHLDDVADAGQAGRRQSGAGCPFPRKSPIKSCFGAGTLVATAEGERPIEEIEVGDLVYAYDEETGEVELKEVVQLYSRQRDEIYVLHVDGESIRTTDEHPFWVEGQGWTEVKNLEAGNRLKTLDGETVELDKIEVEAGGEWVFNFAVADLASYFVSEGGFLVHNCSDVYGDGRKRGAPHKELQEGDVDQYRYFSNRPGDGLEGHEVWQSANTSAHGLGGRTGSMGGRNPSIALARADHKIVNRLQREMIPSPRTQTPLENIEANIRVLREAQKLGVKITDRQINDAAKRAVRFYQRMKDGGFLN